MPDLRSITTATVAHLPESSPGSDGLSFTIGQDAAGCWVALESHGIAGGLFRNRSDAIHFADREIRHGNGEIRFATAPVAFSVGR